MTQYINLHLVLEKVKGSDHTSRAQLEHETKGNPDPVEFTFAPDSVLTDGKDVRYYFDRIAEIRAGTEGLEVVGRALYERVFQNPLGELLRTWFEDLKSDQKFRLRLDIRTPELAAVPWELLWDEKHFYFLARRGISIVRFTGNARKDDVGLGPTLKVLVVSANPGGQMEFNEDRYVEPVKALFAGYENVTVDGLTGAVTTYEGLHERLTEHKYDLFHFVGHGRYERGGGKIYVVGNQRRPKPVMGSDLAGWLHDSGVQFAFLCSCQTGKPGQQNPFRGVAQNLVGAGIPAVMAMQYDMPQDDAKPFVEAFYKRLLRLSNMPCLDINLFI